MVQIAVHEQESTCWADKGMLVIHKIGTHGAFKAINTIGYLYMRTLGLNSPGILVDLVKFKKVTIRIFHLQLLHDFCKFTDEVGTRRPDRHFEVKVILVKSFKDHSDLHIMCLRLNKR